MRFFSLNRRASCVFSVPMRGKYRFQYQNNSLIQSDGFSHLFNFASAAFVKKAFAFFAVRDVGFFSYRYISQGELEQFNKAVLC